MDIEIDDGGAIDQPLLTQFGGGDGDIIEHAKAFAVVRERVVGAPRQITGKPGL